MHLLDYFERKYSPSRLIGKSDNTRRLYRGSIRAFGTTLGKAPGLGDLTNENIQLHMQARLDNGLSPATANKDRNQLLAIWRHAFSAGMVKTLPDVMELTEPQRTPIAWMPDEITRLFNAIQRLEGEIEGIPRFMWWDCLIRIGLDTGERIGALRESKWEWLNGQWINFPAEVRKGGKRDRSYRLSVVTLGKLGRLRFFSKSPEMFPWPYHENYLWAKYKEILKSAGLPAGRRNAFHQLRRTLASAVFAAGLDAQEALDHQHKKTTQRYLDPRMSRSIQPCDILADFLANPEKKGRDTA